MELRRAWRIYCQKTPPEKRDASEFLAAAKTVTNEEVTQEQLGGADTHTAISGVAHRAPRGAERYAGR